MSDNNEIGAVWLERINWQQAEEFLCQQRVIVLPLGAAAKQHGPHLPLNNDALIAGWLTREVAARLPVVIAPLVNVSFYPAFTDYPGSVSLDLETAAEMLLQITESLARHGASRFYVLNTGVSTEAPLSRVRKQLQKQRIAFEYLRLDLALSRLAPGLLEQGWGSHADEHETSLMLHIAPEVVDMSRALDDGREGRGRLSRNRGDGIYSPSGVFGQATLASAAKGKAVASAMLDQVIEDIESMSRSGQVLPADEDGI